MDLRGDSSKLVLGSVLGTPAWSSTTSSSAASLCHSRRQRAREIVGEEEKARRAERRCHHHLRRRRRHEGRESLREAAKYKTPKWRRTRKPRIDEYCTDTESDWGSFSKPSSPDVRELDSQEQEELDRANALRGTPEKEAASFGSG